MSTNNGTCGIIRVGRKGRRKFAFGEDGEPFEVDVVVAFQEWVCIDDQFREGYEDRIIPPSAMAEYHRAAVEFAKSQACDPVSGDPQHGNPPTEITTAEALDFIARLRECYDEVADFFQPKSRAEPDSQDTSAAELRFSVEGSES